MSGYYFTKREQEEMQKKGYSIKLCSSQDERDKLAEEYKVKNYKVRKAYNTTMVRGIYSYYLWIKYEGIKEKAEPQIKYSDRNKEKEYQKLCEQSAKRVLPKIKKYIASENLHLNEPCIAGPMYNKGKRIGNCQGKRIIRIQATFLDKGNLENIDKCMIHEILHCVKETKGHDKLFKSLQKNMGDIMGYQIGYKNRGGILNVSVQ